ncbi:hypothetical protein CsSME_00037177 [Camellia sinensis var. sinensis]
MEANPSQIQLCSTHSSCQPSKILNLLKISLFAPPFIAPCFHFSLFSSSSSSSTMAFKTTSHVFLIILWLSLFILLFHELYTTKSKINHSTTIPSLYHRHPISRKFLASKFDFTPFLKHRHHHYHRRHHHHHEPDESAVDPRYGVEKRRVPTGPNPLHH